MDTQVINLHAPISKMKKYDLKIYIWYTLWVCPHFYQITAFVFLHKKNLRDSFYVIIIMCFGWFSSRLYTKIIHCNLNNNKIRSHKSKRLFIFFLQSCALHFDDGIAKKILQYTYSMKVHAAWWNILLFAWKLLQ